MRNWHCWEERTGETCCCRWLCWPSALSSTTLFFTMKRTPDGSTLLDSLGKLGDHCAVIIIVLTKWDLEMHYFSFASRWLCRLFSTCVAAEQDLLRLFGPKVFAFSLSVLLRAFFFLSSCLSFILLFSHLLQLLKFLRHTRLFVMCMSWNGQTEVCLIFKKKFYWCLIVKCKSTMYLIIQWIKKCVAQYFCLFLFFLVKPCPFQFQSGSELWFHTWDAFGISCVLDFNS